MLITNIHVCVSFHAFVYLILFCICLRTYTDGQMHLDLYLPLSFYIHIYRVYIRELHTYIYIHTTHIHLHLRLQRLGTLFALLCFARGMDLGTLFLSLSLSCLLACLLRGVSTCQHALWPEDLSPTARVCSSSMPRPEVGAHSLSLSPSSSPGHEGLLNPLGLTGPPDVCGGFGRGVRA